MVVLAISDVLAALAAPGFGPLIKCRRARDAGQSLHSRLFYACSEAIKRGGNVTVLKTPSGNGCVSAEADTQWGCCWTVFADTTNNSTHDTGQTRPEDTLKTIPVLTRAEINIADSNGHIPLERWGQLDSASSKSSDFRLMPQQGTATRNTAVSPLCVGFGGHVKRLTKGDGVGPS